MDIDIYLSFHIYIHTISYIPEYSTVYRLQGIPSQTAESTRFCPSRSMQYAPVTVSIPYRAGSFSCIQTSKAPPNNFKSFSLSLSLSARSPSNNSITFLCYIPSSFFCPRGLVVAYFSSSLILFPFPSPFIEARHVPFHVAPDVTADRPSRRCSSASFLEFRRCSSYDLLAHLKTGLRC